MIAVHVHSWHIVDAESHDGNNRGPTPKYLLAREVTNCIGRECGTYN